MHLKGFFYLITYRQEERRGHPVPLPAIVSADAYFPDWGNPRLVGFAEMVRNWTTYFHTVSANGYFKAAIRANPENEPIWSFALEWNRSYRIAGFIGDQALIEAHASRLPDEGGWKPLPGRNRIRELVRLDPAADFLFAVDS
jgi:hypothetical protein